MPEPAERKRRVLASLADDPWAAPPWLRDPDAQTLWAGLLRRPAAPPLVLQRWPTPDDDFVRVHVYDGAGSAVGKNSRRGATPVLVITHGLEGSVRSPYVTGIAAAAAARGWSVVAWEHRSCGGELNRARRLYHMGETGDLGFVVRRTAERFPGRPLCLAGYSLGGNQLAKYLGERGTGVPDPVVAAAVICSPYDVTRSAPYIEHALGGLYRINFLRTLIPKALAKERQHPGCLDGRAVRGAWSFESFDTHATAALHGFLDARDYWARASCGPYLDDIRVPTLLLSARDDPFNPAETFPAAAAARSPWLHPVLAAGGGHVGFVQGSPWRARAWGEAQVMRFFAAYTA